MALGNEGARLSFEEHRMAKENGVNAAIAAQLGAQPEWLKVLTSKNVEHRTLDGVLGFMEVTVEWTDPVEQKWHWHSFRFNGDNPIDLSDEHLTILGGFACARETEVKDFTRDSNNLLLRRPEPAMALIPELPLPEVYPTLEPAAELAETAA